MTEDAIHGIAGGRVGRSTTDAAARRIFQDDAAESRKAA